MAVLAQVSPVKIAMDATATSNNANLVTVSGSTYLHGVSLADFAITCGNLPGITMWAPIQNECSLGTLANNIDQTLFMDAVYINNLEFGFTNGANTTENYGAETATKMWLLNDGRYVNWEGTTFVGGETSFTVASGVNIASLSDGSMGFLRASVAGERGVTYYDASANTMLTYPVVSGTASIASSFAYDASTFTMHVPTDITIAAGDKVFALFAADAYTTAMGNNYFTALTDINRPVTIGATRPGQVEAYLVSDSDSSLDTAWRLTGVTITSAMTRDPLHELGHMNPYDRPLTLPIPITMTIDTTAGDLEHWSRFADLYPEYKAGTMNDIALKDLMASKHMKLVVKIFAQTDQEAGGTGTNRKVAAHSSIIGKAYFNNGTKGINVAGQREYALKTIVVEHIIGTNEAYTLNMGTNATQTFGFRSVNDLFAVKGDIPLATIQAGIRRNA